jgi:hypothetical protein
VSVLDYDPDGMDALASRLVSAALSIMGERSRIKFLPAPGFAGPAAIRYRAHASNQANRLESAHAELLAAASALSSKAAEVRVEQAALRARIKREAEQRAEFNRIVREGGG